MTNHSHFASFLLRVGLAAVFLYVGTASLLMPEDWASYFPNFIAQSDFAEMLIYAHGLAEIVLAVWLLSNKKIYLAAWLSALAMASIIVVNIELLDVVFRDFAIMFMALALATLSKHETTK